MDPSWWTANVGIPPFAQLTTYTGPCTITVANTVIDSKVVNCRLVIRATGVVIRDSRINGGVTSDGNATVNLSRSLLDGGVNTDTTLPALGYHGITGDLLDLRGGQHSLQCDGFCDVRNSWLHAQTSPANRGYHNNAMISNGGHDVYLQHNRLECNPADNGNGGGCSGDASLFGDFGNLSRFTFESNLFMATPGSFCFYAGNEPSKPGKPDNIVVRNNVWQRNNSGLPHAPNTRGCAYYGPVTSWDPSRPGMVWQNNTWDSGGPVPL